MKSLVRGLVVGPASLTVLLVAPPAASQMRLELDGTGAKVFETDGPRGACGYPTGPVTGSFSYVAPFTCPTAGPVAHAVPARRLHERRPRQLTLARRAARSCRCRPRCSSPS